MTPNTFLLMLRFVQQAGRCRRGEPRCQRQSVARVFEFQAMLAEFGYLPEDEIDGKYGPKTRARTNNTLTHELCR